MAYTKQKFVHGQVLTEEHLNHMEDGIGAVDATATSLVNDLDKVKDRVSDVEWGVKDVVSGTAIIGTVTDSPVYLEDVSSVDHKATVEVIGKNLWNNLAFSTEVNKGSTVYISDVTSDHIFINCSEDYNGNGHVQTSLKLKDVCPRLKSGYNYRLNGESVAWIKAIYLKEADAFWYFGHDMVVTEQLLNSTVGLYGFHTINEQPAGLCSISNIQISRAGQETEYTPYVDTSSITVTQCGRNLNNMTYRTIVPSITNGEETTYNGWASDFIYIGNNDVIFYSLNQNEIKQISLLLYDKNKTFIGASVTKLGSERLISRNIAGYENAKYCRIRYDGNSIDGNTVNNLHLIFGSTVVGYPKYNGETITPGSDGICNFTNNVIYPDTIYVSNSGGVNLSVRYYKNLHTIIRLLTERVDNLESKIQ